jgi:hypothetical protein
MRRNRRRNRRRMKQTAVEWLANEFYEKLEVKGDGALFNDLVNQAKEMEIEKLKSAWDASDTNMRNQFSSSAYKGITFNEWFETFKNK